MYEISDISAPCRPLIMPHAFMTGSGTQRGKQYAAAWKDPLTFLRPLLPPAPCWEEKANSARRVIESFLRSLGREFPDLYEELLGIAEGADLCPERVGERALVDGFSWGLRPDGASSPAGSSGCTCLSIMEQCREPMLMQTIDAPDAGWLILHRVAPRDGYRHLFLARLGATCASVGFNEHGLAVGGVSCSVSGQNLDGLPLGVLRRACLQYCANVHEAVALMNSHDVMFGGYTVNLADRAGNNIVVEKAPGAQQLRRREKPCLYNTKFVTAPMRRLMRTTLDPSDARGYDRLNTFERLLSKETPPHDRSTMERIMSDHSSQGPIWDWSTAMGSIVLLRSGRMYIYSGPPDETYPMVTALETGHSDFLPREDV